MSTCAFIGCLKEAKKRGWCGQHYLRWYRNGDPAVTRKAQAGEGFLQDGYPAKRINGRIVFDHVAIAEKALGKPIQAGVQVHHVDEDRKNNSHSNLVICPDIAYHKLLHVRTAALEETGDADQRKCRVCKKYDRPENLRFDAGGKSIRHAACINAYNAGR